MARLAIQLVGGVIGSFTPLGFGVGAFIGGIIGNLLFPQKLPTIVGPRLEDLTVNSSAYGKVIPIHYGTPMAGGNIIWSTGLEEVKTTTKQGGGKGGGPTQSTVTFTYFADFAVAFGKGPLGLSQEIEAYGRMWADTKMIYDPIDGPTSVLFAEQTQFYFGRFNQLPDTLIEADKGVGNVPAHRGLAYIVFSNFALKDFGNRIPHIRAELINSSTAPVTFSTIPVDASNTGSTVKMFYSWDRTKIYSIWVTDAAGKISDFSMAAYDAFTLNRIAGPTALTMPLNTGGFDWDFLQLAIVGDDVHPIQPAPDGDIYLRLEGERISDSAHALALMRIDGNSFGLKDITLPANVIVTVEVDPPANSEAKPASAVIYIGYYTDSNGLPFIEATYTIPFMGYRDIGLGFATHPRKMVIWGGGLGTATSPSLNTVKTITADDDYDDGTGDYPNFDISNPPGGDQLIYPNNICIDGKGQLWTMFVDQVASPNVKEHLLFNSVGLIKRQVVTTFDNATPSSMNVFTPRGPIYVKSINRMIFWHNQNSGIGEKGFWIFEVNPETLVLTNEYRVPGTESLTLVAASGPLGGQSPDVNAVFPPWNQTIYSTDPTQDIIFQVSTTQLIRYNPESRSVTFPVPIITSVPAHVSIDRGDTFYNWQRNAYSTGKTLDRKDWEFYNLDRVTLGITNVKAIVDDIEERADPNLNKNNTPLDDLTTSDINAPGRHDVLGFSIQNRESARQTLETLTLPFMFNIIENGTSLDAIDRIGDAPAGEVIPEGDLGAYEAGTDPPAIITEIRRQEIELPARVDVSYISRPRDYEAGLQHAKRIAELISTQEKIDLRIPVVLSDNQAKQIANSALFNAWISRESYEFTLPPKWLKLNPGDFLQLPVGDVLKRVIVTNVELGDSGLLKLKAERDDSEVFDTDSVGTPAPVIPNRDLLTPPLPTTLILMDLPLLRDLDDGIGFYYAVGGPAGWQGATVLRSTADLSNFFIFDTVTSDRNSIIGFAVDVLADGPTTIFDRGNTITINLLNSSEALTSITENAMLSTDINAALLGSELIQFQTVVDNGDGTFTLSKLIRGGKGTEQHTGTHTVGETFVLLEPAKMGRFFEDAADVGIEHLYKEITFNQLFDDVTPTAFTNTGISEKPLSPVHIKGSRASNDDLTITWIRRVRKQGEWLDNVDVPLDEATEDYEVDILDAPGGTVARIITNVASANGSVITPATQTCFYDAADQTADVGITAGDPIDVEVFQLSAVRGRGFPGVKVV